MRPPSSGKPGIRLKTASATLISQSHVLDATTSSLPWKKRATSQNAPPRTRLDIGPASAIKNSCVAVAASRLIREIPPKMKSVIDSTGMRYSLATTVWLSSWKTTDAKNRMLVMMPSPMLLRRPRLVLLGLPWPANT